MNESKIVDTLKRVDTRGLLLPMAVIYEKPKDFPENYVVRIWDTTKPTNIVYVSDDLEKCRKEINELGLMLRMGAENADDPCIVEVWI